jgi:hypothetical protein
MDGELGCKMITSLCRVNDIQGREGESRDDGRSIFHVGEEYKKEQGTQEGAMILKYISSPLYPKKEPKTDKLV